MSTQIYCTCKIPTTDMRALLRIAKEIQRIEMPTLLRSLAAKHSLYIPDELKSAVNRVHEGDDYKAKNILKRALTRFAVLTLTNPTIHTDPDDCDYFCNDIRQALPDVQEDGLASLVAVIEDVAKCRQLTFLPTKHGFTLMKWYNLTEKTQRWLKKHFEDFDYQDSTDGPPLSELNAALDADIERRVQEFIFDELKYNFEDIVPERAEKLVTEVKDHVKYFVARSMYKKRDEVWTEAVGNISSYAESGLSFDLYSGWKNAMSTVCYATLLRACLPAADQDHVELAKAIIAKQKEDEWLRRIMDRQKKSEEEISAQFQPSIHYKANSIYQDKAETRYTIICKPEIRGYHMVRLQPNGEMISNSIVVLEQWPDEMELIGPMV